MKITQGNDVVLYDFRQSWINTYVKCPEQARQEMMGLSERKVTDAMAFGSALHSVVEQILAGDSGKGALDKGMEYFLWMAEGGDGPFKWDQFKSPAEVEETLRYAAISWMHYVRPTINLTDTCTIEKSFRVQLDERSDPWGQGTQQLWLNGTWDFADDTPVLWDWKSASREWQGWEAKRYFWQPTVYSYGYMATHDGEMPQAFNYVVIEKQKRYAEPQIIPVKRTVEDFNWMKRFLWNIVDLNHTTHDGHVAWPLMDQGWHCSPKWCGAWDTCKGLDKGSSPW